MAAAPEDRWRRLTPGFALVRTGQFEPAAKQLRLVLDGLPEVAYARDKAYGMSVLTWILLTLADHGRGEGEQARLWLAKAVQWMDREMSENNVGALRKQSQVWAMCQVLRGEAESVFGSP